MKTNCIGLDVGTTNISGLLLNGQTGGVLRTVTRKNDSGLPAPQGFALQDPRRILEICREILEELCPGGGAACGISGQMHGVLYLNAGGEAISPLVTWQDKRGDLPHREGGSHALVLATRTGHPVPTGYGVATLFYDAQNGGLPRDMAGFCTIGDYVAMALCGQTAPAVHPSNAQSVGLFHLARNCFDQGAAERAGIDARLLPSITGEAVLGTAPGGLPVACAIGDNQAAVLGSLGRRQGMLVNIGTGSQVSVSSPQLLHVDGMECRPYVGGGFLLTGAALCGGRAFQLLGDFFAEAAALMGCSPPKDLYERLTQAAQEAGDTMGLAVDPRFLGTRLNPDWRGAIRQVDLNNFRPGVLARAFLQGIARELALLYGALPPALRRAKLMAGSGNALRRNPVLRRELEAAFCMPLHIPRCREEAAYGAALFGGVAAGVIPNWQAASDLIQYDGSEGEDVV